MRLILIYFIFIFYYFTNSLYEEDYIIFPLKKIKINPNKLYDDTLDISSEIINILIPNNIYVSLKISSSKIEFNSFLSFTQSFLSIGKDSFISNNTITYNINNSSSSKIISNITVFNLDTRKYEKVTHFQESIYFPNSYFEIEFESMNCFSYLNEELKFSIFGLDLNRNKIQQSLIKGILDKYQNILKKSYFSIIFKNDSNIFQINSENFRDNNDYDIDGEILIGIPPHEYYKNIYFSHELIEINTQCSRDQLSWIIRFDSVYTEDSKNNIFNYFIFDKMTYYDFDQYFGVFYPEINPIYVPHSIFDYYMNNYFDKHLNKECLKRGRPLYNKYLTSVLFKRMQIFVYCDKSKIADISKFYDEFPSLNLKNIYFKDIFVFKGKELFLEDKKYIYFMLIPEFTKNNKFLLGRMFMSKYQFVFNYDTKTIGYYNKNLSYIKNNWNESDNEENNNNNNYYYKSNLFILIITIILFLIIFGICIYYVVNYLQKNNNNEKQALELSYMKKEDSNENL